ncbi:DUF3987 domain-containing protein [Nitratiruptor sp. SB155-2]|uniref:DUF3987 domain-containing protein n=1 Tax=Nitratiruptor sp. (strain SB155-2) TaxID=387092 RepID=UPI00015872D0|nr:DUF3987 domain-containing protein [Nitratiruptor sp. SB155-2]BAF70430.1 conserved hypothetical protein [Nitratiruptor sp. SB155-2]
MAIIKQGVMDILGEELVKEALDEPAPQDGDGVIPVSEVTNEIVAQEEENIKTDDYINKTIDKELLPYPIKEYFEDISDRLNLPFEEVATTSFAFLSNLITDKLCLVPTNDISYKIIPNLWGCIIAEKGTRKTPLFQAFSHPIYQKHFTYVDRFKEEKERYEMKMKALENKRRQLVKAEAEGDIEKTDELKEAIHKLEKETESKPKSRYLILTDTTKEKLTDILESNSQGILIFQDEITRLIYNFVKDPEMRSLILESWSGASKHTIGRINRGDVNIEKLTIGLFGGIQPELYKQLILAQEDNIASGFNDRFQLIYVVKDFQYQITDKEQNELIYSEFKKLVDTLIDMKLQNYTKAKEYPYIKDLYYLKLNDDAKKMFKEFMEGLNNDLSQEYPILRGFLSKSDKLLGSLAILLHTIEAINEQKEHNYIDADIMYRAIEITKFYIYQAIEASHIAIHLEEQKEINFEKKRDRVLSYTLKQKLPIKLRDIYRPLKGISKKEALQILEPYYVIEKEGQSYIVKEQKSNALESKY